jgi:large subunit ribosomal protein L17
MRHRVKRRKLSLDHDHRLAVTKNLARSLFLSGKVTTTQAKARVLVSFAERLVSRAKKGDLVAKRFVYHYFQDQNLANLVVEKTHSVFKDRNGGYTRTIKVKRRKGDNAVLIRVEFTDSLGIDFKKPEPEKKPQKKDVKKTKSEKLKTKKESKK